MRTFKELSTLAGTQEGHDVRTTSLMEEVPGTHLKEREGPTVSQLDGGRCRAGRHCRWRTSWLAR
jgi:hypothetical protein